MLYHRPETVYSPSDYNELLNLFKDKISIDIILFRTKEAVELIKKAIDAGHLQESKVDSGSRNLLFLTKIGSRILPVDKIAKFNALCTRFLYSSCSLVYLES